MTRRWKIVVGLLVALVASVGWSLWRHGGQPPGGLTLVTVVERFVFVAGALLVIEGVTFLMGRGKSEKGAERKRNRAARSHGEDNSKA